MTDLPYLQRSGWTTDDQRFRFDFETNLNKNDSFYIVNVSLQYATTLGNQRLVWENIQLIVDSEEFVFFDDDIDSYCIKGSLKAFIEKNNNGETNLVVWGDIRYGIVDKPYHFIGPLSVEKIKAAFPPSQIDPVIEPAIANIAPVIAPDTYHDLFPFIYLNNWSDFNEHEFKFSFVVYEPFNTSPPANSFFYKLLVLKNANDRNGMEEEAVKLIEKEDLYGNIFVTSLEDLIGTIVLFPPVSIEINKLDNYDALILFICEFFETTTDEFYNYLKSQDYLFQKERLWQSYFALIIRLGYRYQWLDQISKLIVICNLMEEIFFNITEDACKTPFDYDEVKDLMQASIILPNSIFPMPPYPCSPPVVNTSSWIEPYAIGRLQLVKQRFLRYEMGEIANVVSVMPGEKKENSKRKRHQETVSSVQSVVNENSQIQNTEERSSDLAGEVLNTLKHNKDTFTYNDYSTEYGAPTSMTLKGSYDIDKTSDPNQVKALSFAKKIITATSGNITKKVSFQRMHCVNNELEETSVSILDNTGNNKAIYGTYHWLNKVYEARLVNYGSRLMLSFLIENPAAKYIKEEFNFNNEKLDEIKSPKAVFDISTFNDITIENYLQICAYYDVEDFVLPPDSNKIITGTLEGNESKILDIPEGYKADTAFVTYVSNSGVNAWQVNGFVGRQAFRFEGSCGTAEPLKLAKQNLTIPISSACDNMYLSPPMSIKSFRINIEVECICSDKKIKEWKQKIYVLIMQNYKKQRKAYFNELNTEISVNTCRNPLYDRNTIKKELKKSCIKQLLYNMIKTKDLSIKHPSGSPTAFEVYKRRILSFLNNAIEWNEMTYTLQEDFGNDVDHVNMADISSGEDHVFAAFLQAAGARIIIPAKPEYNHSLLYFFKTGSIWMGKDMLVPVFNDQVSLISELKHLYYRSEDEVLECWEFKVPTSLQLLSKDNDLHIKN